MAFILYLSIASAVPLILWVQSLIPLMPLLSFQPCTRLRFSPNKLSGCQIATLLVFLFLKSVLKQLGLVPSLRPSRAKDSPARNEDAFHLPEVRIEMPVVVSRADMELYESATCAPNNASPTSGANSLFLLSPVTEPLMLLLLARLACPILPLGSVNVRNRFEFLSPGECKNVSLRTLLRAEASLRRKGRRVKRGVEFDVLVEVFGEETGELIFRQVMTILQFLHKMVEPKWHEAPQKESSDIQSLPDEEYKRTSEKMVTIQDDAPSKWAALCKDYNPIHVSALAARLFGFPGKIAHGNQAAAMTVESLASTPGSLTRNLWLDSSRASFMDVEFRRPMVVPLQLRVKTVDDATAQRSKESDEALRVAYNQIAVWAVQDGLTDDVQQAAKAHYKRINDLKAFEDRSQVALLAGCIFIACRDCNVPRTFSEICGFTHVPKKEIGGIYKSLERFLASAHDETVQRYRLYGKDKVYVMGQVGWLGKR
jgi:acyl dehydratase